MEAAQIFSICNQVILLGWVLLIFLPNWKYTQTIILNGLLVLFACIYAFLILKDIGNFNPESFSTLANVKALFQNDNAIAAGWIHYLAFDLFVGTYIVKKSREIGLSRVLYTITLPFTFMFGPMGYLLFFIFKTIKTKTLNETN
ncbi:MAG: DUF4281 domain-containing protein [Chitinophaga sp.]|nr:DUF4281 domain-containing protein [Chitinophaga sp.]PJE46521.1 MAG: DUF4281 domain-containing protein [Sediminibacterium sp.] [Sediminibacterium sp. FEMGT703S]